MAEEVKGSTPVPYMSMGICENGLQPYGMYNFDHYLGG